MSNNNDFKLPKNQIAEAQQKKKKSKTFSMKSKHTNNDNPFDNNKKG